MSLRDRNKYDAYVEGLYALYHPCECHDGEHELDMQCRCDVCYSNAMDILWDQQCDAQMEKEWDRHQNQ